MVCVGVVEFVDWVAWVVEEEGMVAFVVGLAELVPQAVKSRAAAMAQTNSFFFIVFRRLLYQKTKMDKLFVKIIPQRPQCVNNKLKKRLIVNNLLQTGNKKMSTSKNGGIC